MKSLLVEDKEPFILNIEYHGCWYLNNTRSQLSATMVFTQLALNILVTIPKKLMLLCTSLGNKKAIYSLIHYQEFILLIVTMKSQQQSVIPRWLKIHIIPTFGIRARAALSCLRGKNSGGYGCYWGVQYRQAPIPRVACVLILINFYQKY